MSLSPRVVIPGDQVPEMCDRSGGGGGNDDTLIVLGPGLRRESASSVIVTKAGVLRHKRQQQQQQPPSDVYWVDCHSKRYVAARGESVIGVVTNKMGDSFRVDIGTSEQASLSFLAFEGATKKNRPNVNVGDVVYAKLLVASRDMEAELVCVDSYGKRSGLGVLSGGGFVFSVPLHVIRKLLSPSCVLLSTLGTNIPFEVAVGMNGRIWIRGKTAKETISLANAIAAAEFMTNEEIKKMVNKLVDALKGF